ncbi:SHD1 domain-containing protein [Botrimarina sp.]|uniref:SHD1 domain-containing protein n=1 Tax=Botrimarina sp. TaxID=2795802 RepID=UPI0032F08030
MTIANAQELVAAAPDPGLSHDLLKALGERELAFEAFRRKNKPGEAGAQELVVALVHLAAPDGVEAVLPIGAQLGVGPVADFDAFVDSIDYARVLSKSADRRVLRVEVDPAEITLEKLRQRYESHPAPHFSARRLFEQPATGFGDMHAALPQPSQVRDLLGGGPEQLGAAIEEGNRVEIDLAKTPFRATVRDMETDAFGNRLALVELRDTSPLEKGLRDAGLRARVRRSESIAFWAPVSRLRKATGPDIAPAHERTWTDATGKFRIEATYVGLDGESVRIRKSGGKETLVPLAKLSDADRRYVADRRAAEAAPIEKNPFADPKESESRSLRADWSGVAAVRVQPDARQARYAPPAAASPVEPAVDSLQLGRPLDPGPLGERLIRLDVAPDGSAAIAVVESGLPAEERHSVQYLDFSDGRAEPLYATPAGSVVLDADAAQRVVLLKGGDVADQSARLFVYHLAPDGLRPSVDFDAAPPDAFHEQLEAAYSLAGGRVMTRCLAGDYVVWRRDDAKALHRLPGSISGSAVQVAPDRRHVAIGGDGIALVDTQAGATVVAIPDRFGRVHSIGLDSTLSRIAFATSEGLVLGGDLRTGKRLFLLTASSRDAMQIDWIGGWLLLDGADVIEPHYPVTLWRYFVADSFNEHYATARAGRVWYGPKRGGKGGLYVGSIPAPHDAMTRTHGELPPVDELLLVERGDDVRLEIDTDLGPQTAERLRDSVGEALASAGYRVRHEDDPEPLAARVRVSCKALPQQELRINTTGRPFPKDKDLERRTVRPYASSIEMLVDEEVVWSQGWTARPGHIIHLLPGEELDDALKRLTTPDVDSLAEANFPVEVTQDGRATAGGHYGASILSHEGVVQDWNDSSEVR